MFVDGGDDGNPPIKPDCSHTTKQVKVLRIADGTLNVLTKHHKMKKGLEIRRDDGNPIFILCVLPAAQHCKADQIQDDNSSGGNVANLLKDPGR